MARLNLSLLIGSILIFSVRCSGGLVGGADLDPATDRAMICGSSAMLRELKGLLEERGFAEGSTSRPGDFVIERAFVDQ